MNPKTCLHLIASNADVKSHRLCDTCASGVVMRTAGIEEPDVFCLFINCRVSPGVVHCNRYAQRESAPGAAAPICESAWVS
jgi:hypothetical protein